MWKSLGGIMLNGVPREVPRPKPKGPQARRVLAARLPEGLHSPWYPKGFSHIFILLASRTSKEGFISANGIPRQYHGHFTGHGFPILVELNPNILVWHVERMYSIHGLVLSVQDVYLDPLLAWWLEGTVIAFKGQWHGQGPAMIALYYITSNQLILTI